MDMREGRRAPLLSVRWLRLGAGGAALAVLTACGVLAVACESLGQADDDDDRKRPIIARATTTPTPAPQLPPNARGVLRWIEFPVKYCIDYSVTSGYLTYNPQEFGDVVDRAFQAWGVPHRHDGICPRGIQAGDGLNQIGWGELDQASLPEGTYEAGITHVQWLECGFDCDPNNPVKLVEADITIDRDPPQEFRNEHCLYTTLVHEVGHLMGIDHLLPPAVMASYTADCEEELQEADRAALFERYGDAFKPSPNAPLE